MPNLKNGAWTMAVLVVGLGAVFYASDSAYSGADLNNSTVVADLHPIAQDLLWATTYGLLIVGAIAIIGGVGTVLSGGSRGR